MGSLRVRQNLLTKTKAQTNKQKSQTYNIHSRFKICIIDDYKKNLCFRSNSGQWFMGISFKQIILLLFMLFMGFSMQEYWSGLPFPSPGCFLTQRLYLSSSALQADSLPSEISGKPWECVKNSLISLWFVVQNSTVNRITFIFQKICTCEMKKEQMLFFLSSKSHYSW